MIMACACNKNRATTGVTAKRVESTADTAAHRQATASGQDSSQQSTSPAMRGATQSFALQQRGQSSLERAAAAARSGQSR